MVKHSAEYERYMRSEAWERKRSERLELDGNRCVMCGRPNGLQKDGATPILQVHHIHYRNLGHGLWKTWFPYARPAISGYINIMPGPGTGAIKPGCQAHDCCRVAGIRPMAADLRLEMP